MRVSPQHSPNQQDPAGTSTYVSRVQHGAQLGRTLGFPTANLSVADDGNSNGVYAARVTRADGTVHDAAASLGVRPTVTADGERLLEVHVLDTQEWLHLYDETIEVELIELIRAERKFPSLDHLKAQISADCAEIRARLGCTSAG